MLNDPGNRQRAMSLCLWNMMGGAFWKAEPKKNAASRVLI